MVILKKIRKRIESRLLNEWLREKHLTSLQWKRVRVGPIPNPEIGRASVVLMRWADAIFIEDGFVNIVEAKIRPNAEAIGQLEYYKKKFPETPEFTVYKDWPIKMIFLTTMLDAGIAEHCWEKGIKYRIYAPKWALEELAR